VARELEPFLDGIDDRLGDDVEVDAGEAAHAVVAALVSRLTRDQAEELRAALPSPLGRALSGARGEQPFDRDALIEEVAARLDLDDLDGERVAHAVLAAIRSALEPGTEREQVLEALPSDLAQLMQFSD
jgi:uncharacterized protein (DUF2267 family)